MAPSILRETFIIWDFMMSLKTEHRNMRSCSHVYVADSSPLYLDPFFLSYISSGLIPMVFKYFLHVPVVSFVSLPYCVVQF